jgi:hypothetical protein
MPKERGAYSSLLAHNESHAMLVYERGTLNGDANVAAGSKTLTWRMVAF